MSYNPALRNVIQIFSSSQAGIEGFREYLSSTPGKIDLNSLELNKIIQRRGVEAFTFTGVCLAYFQTKRLGYLNSVESYRPIYFLLRCYEGRCNDIINFFNSISEGITFSVDTCLHDCMFCIEEEEEEEPTSICLVKIELSNYESMYSIAICEYMMLCALRSFHLNETSYNPIVSSPIPDVISMSDLFKRSGSSNHGMFDRNRFSVDTLKTVEEYFIKVFSLKSYNDLKEPVGDIESKRQTSIVGNITGASWSYFG